MGRNNNNLVVGGDMWGFIVNIILSYATLMIARVAYFCANYSYFADILSSWQRFSEAMCGAMVFDTAAVVYINALYAVLLFFPLHLKECEAWRKILKVIFVSLNIIAFSGNLADAVYFPFTGRRTTATIFSEFSGEGNIAQIIGIEALKHWYFFLLAGVWCWILWRVYRDVKIEWKGKRIKYYLRQVAALAVVAGLAVGGVRGGFRHSTRPITISNANQYVNRPIEAAVVLNSTFSLIRTIGKQSFVKPDYMSDAEMNSIFTAVILPPDSAQFKPKNVVVLIMESFGEEYIAAARAHVNGKTVAKSYTPFLDSLAQQSLRFDTSLANGRKSIDGMPSILSSIPMFVEPFFLSSAAMNNVSGIAGLLAARKGYDTAFFHGAPNGSMGFQAFARATGFNRYYGLDEYCADKSTGGNDDFDGMWAIWDAPFLQYFARTLTSEMREPFTVALFTASSHHPFAVPQEYEGRFPEGSLPIHKCVGYSDNALRQFFAAAKKQPWFENTLFVITADHTNQSEHAEYQTDLGVYRVPIIFYAPDGSFAAVDDTERVAQQIDIMPTVLGALGYDLPFVAFGENLLTVNPEDSIAFNYNNGIYQFVTPSLFVQFDGVKITAVYEYKTDVMLEHNLVGTDRCPDISAIEHRIKATIQQYMTRMTSNTLTLQ